MGTDTAALVLISQLTVVLFLIGWRTPIAPASGGGHSSAQADLGQTFPLKQSQFPHL